jgi:hypothetical protein
MHRIVRFAPCAVPLSFHPGAETGEVLVSEITDLQHSKSRDTIIISTTNSSLHTKYTLFPDSCGERLFAYNDQDPAGSQSVLSAGSAMASESSGFFASATGRFVPPTTPAYLDLKAHYSFNDQTLRSQFLALSSQLNCDNTMLAKQHNLILF